MKKREKRYESLAALSLMFNILKITASLQSHYRLSLLVLNRCYNASSAFSI